MSFGAQIKELRLACGKTLRQFCLEFGYDPSNWSKIERDVNPPPKENNNVIKMGVHLGLNENSSQMQDFLDQAAIARGQIPQDVMSDNKLLEKLPVFFRTIRGAEFNEENIDSLIDKIKTAHSPDKENHEVS